MWIVRGRGFNSPRLHHNVKSQPLSGWDFYNFGPVYGFTSAGLEAQDYSWMFNELLACDGDAISGQAVRLGHSRIARQPCTAAVAATD
jgi:hypothetical protein